MFDDDCDSRVSRRHQLTACSVSEADVGPVPVSPRAGIHWRRLAVRAGIAALIVVLLGINVAGLAQLVRIVPDGSSGDWYYFTLVDPVRPYAFESFFRWAPISAWAWHLLVLPLGWQVWAVLHVAVLGFLRDWRLIGAVLFSWPFWEDALNGNVITFIAVAAWMALRGNRTGIAVFVVLAAVMPRPLMLPVLAWLVWHHTSARWWLAGSILAVVGSSLALGQFDEWLARLAMSGVAEIASPYNIGPSAFIGAWWVPLGLALGVFLTLRGRLGLASLAVSPYWLAYYFVMLLLEARGWPSRTG